MTGPSAAEFRRALADLDREIARLDPLATMARGCAFGDLHAQIVAELTAVRHGRQSIIVSIAGEGPRAVSIGSSERPSGCCGITY
jgi:hypothetical protein